MINSFIDQNSENIKLIDKENGGHGSTINVSIPKATGKYIRILDGDDWVDEIGFNKFIQNYCKKIVMLYLLIILNEAVKNSVSMEVKDFLERVRYVLFSCRFYEFSVVVYLSIYSITTSWLLYLWTGFFTSK